MRRPLATILVVVVAVGCAASGPGVVPDAQMTLNVANYTSVDFQIEVNGHPLTLEPAGMSGSFNYELLGALPWHANVLSPSGRSLLTLDVHSGDVRSSSSGSSGVGARADLSCGRLDLYSGPPMLGPMPGPGVPGDCD